MTTAQLAEERQFDAYGLLVALWHDRSCVANAGQKPIKALSRRTMAARLRSAMVRLFTAGRPFQRGATVIPRCLWAVPEYLPEGNTAGHYIVLSPAPPRYQQGTRTLAAPRPAVLAARHRCPGRGSAASAGRPGTCCRCAFRQSGRICRTSY